MKVLISDLPNPSLSRTLKPYGVCAAGFSRYRVLSAVLPNLGGTTDFKKFALRLMASGLIIFLEVNSNEIRQACRRQI